jgi:hypothetical protein
MPDYGSPSYWDERYAAIGDENDEKLSYEWYQTWQGVQKLVRSQLPKGDSGIGKEGFEVSSICLQWMGGATG